MKNLILLFALSMFLFSCQKEELNFNNESDSNLKADNASNYYKVRNAISKRAESENFCGTDYLYTSAVFINGIEWKYPTSGYEDLMYKGLTHYQDASNDYLFAGLEFPIDGYTYGIGFGNKVLGSDYFPFVTDVKVCIPDKNYSVVYTNALCFAIGNQDFTVFDSVRFVLSKKQTKDLVLVPDTILSFTQLKEKLGTTFYECDSMALYSSLGKVNAFKDVTCYNWSYYGSETSDVYGLQNAGTYTYNLNFGDGLIGSCAGTIDIYLHEGNVIYKCTTSYSIVYSDYLGSRKQLHIYD